MLFRKIFSAFKKTSDTVVVIRHLRNFPLHGQSSPEKNSKSGNPLEVLQCDGETESKDPHFTDETGKAFDITSHLLLYENFHETFHKSRGLPTQLM